MFNKGEYSNTREDDEPVQITRKPHRVRPKKVNTKSFKIKTFKS